MNAVFSMADVVATIHSRVDLFNGTEDVFKRNENLVFSLRRRLQQRCCDMTSADQDDRTCTVTMDSSDNCEINFSGVVSA
jgi:hypothetical protein